MITEAQQQIAQEAAEKAWDDNLIDQNGKTPLRAIILSAIERATEELAQVADRISAENLELRRAAQSQRSEQQEWTPKTKGKRLYFGTGYWDIGEVNARTLETTINAALVAERQRREHEHQITKSLVFKINRLNQQLLSALAAIEKHNKDLPKCICNKIEVDLSPLHKHDAEIRESLRSVVETIVRRTAQSNTTVELNVRTAMMEFDDAPAKVKENP